MEGIKVKSRNTGAFLTFLLSLLIIASCSGVTSNEDDPELHIISVNDGYHPEPSPYDQCVDTCDENARNADEHRACYEKTCSFPAPSLAPSGSVPLKISRPEQTVTLMLGSYEPLTWDVTVEGHTKVGAIILIGHGANNSNVTVNGEPRTGLSRLGAISAPTKTKGLDFRNLIDVEIKKLGFEKVSSFRGREETPETGFTIDGPIHNPKFSPNYLDTLIQPPTTGIEIKAVIGGKIGRFTLDGALIEAKQPFQTPKSPVSSDGRTRYVYNTRKREIRVIDIETNKTAHIIPAAFERGYERFDSLVLDEKRDRLILNIDPQDDFSVIYSIDLDTHEWTQLATLEDYHPNSMIYDDDQDNFITLFVTAYEEIILGRLTPNGHHTIIREFKVSEFQGATDLYEPENDSLRDFYVLGLEGNTIAVATDGGDHFRSDEALGPLKGIYEVDLTTGDIRLTYFD